MMFDQYQDQVLKTIDDRTKDISTRPVVEEMKKNRSPAVIENDVDDVLPLDGTTRRGIVLIPLVIQEET